MGETILEMKGIDKSFPGALVYRLEKIRKLTGLDLREFEHAITFKVALMVKKYLSSKSMK